MDWLKERSLTLVLMALFLLFTVGQLLVGHSEYNSEQILHSEPVITLSAYLKTGHPWEALFENWESEFLQMGVFVIFTVFLYQKGSPESRRVDVIEDVDADPRSFIDRPNVPGPVKRGGVSLWLYERSLGLAFMTLFLVSWIGHLVSGWRLQVEELRSHGLGGESLIDYLTSSTFWFESFQIGKANFSR